MNKEEYQKVEIYLDFATIPTLNYFFHFIENYQDKDTIRLFGLGRFKIPDSVIEQYPAGKIYFAKSEIDAQHEFKQLCFGVLKNIDQKMVLNLHVNLTHSFVILASLLDILFSLEERKCHSICLHLYDDGAEGPRQLYTLSQRSDLEELVAFHKNQMANLLHAGKATISVLGVFRYLWQEIFTTHYHLLDTKVLDLASLAPLKSEMINYHKMSFNHFHKFNQEQKRLFLTLLDLDTKYENQIIDLFKNNKTFVFTGTTMFDCDSNLLNFLENAHTQIIENMIYPEGKYYHQYDDYIFLYKGHPHAKELNKRILEKFNKLINIPEHLPFEVLYLLGLNPTKIGGFFSTSYFQVESDRIADVFFLSSSDPEKNKKYYVFSEQYDLMKVLLALDYVKEEQCHLINFNIK